MINAMLINVIKHLVLLSPALPAPRLPEAEFCPMDSLDILNTKLSFHQAFISKNASCHCTVQCNLIPAVS